MTFDQGVTPELGDTTPRIVGDVGSATGRFGSAASLVLDAGSDANIVFYDSHDGGAPFYSGAEGTIAFWFKRVSPPPAATVFVRPLNDALQFVPAGPIIGTRTTQLGLQADVGGVIYAGLTFAAMAPYLHPDGFDHYAFAWREPDAGGAPDADADIDDGGTYVSPYFVRRFPPMRAIAPFGTLRVGGNTATSPRGELDELAVWKRMLTREEIADVYASGNSIRTTCALP